MKLLRTVLLLLLPVCVTAAQQPQPPGERIQRLEKNARRSMLLLGATACEPPELEIRATTVERDGSVIRMKGAVQIKTDAVTISADEADYYCGTDEIRPRGDVQIRILTPSATK